MDPAVFSLEILALRTATTARSTHHPDHGLEAVLDWAQVHANPLYPRHLGLQLSAREKGDPGERECYHAGQSRSGQITLSLLQTQTLENLNSMFLLLFW